MATNIPRSCFVLATKHTTTPFLYHTRTLTSPSIPLRNHSICRYSRSFSTQNSSNEDDAPTQVSSEDSVDPSAMSEEAPKPRRSFLQKRAASVSAKKPSGPKLEPVAPKKPAKTIAPKITPHEKEIFGGLLKKIGYKHDGVNAEIDPKAKPLSPEKQAEMTELVAMFGNLLQDPQKQRAAKKALKKQEYEMRVAQRKAAEKAANAEAKEAMPSAPSGPRRIKLSDLGYVEPASSAADEVMISVPSAIQMVVEKESEHIEFALFQAVEEGKGDMGVWEVCKERIFSMLRHLDEETFAQASTEDLDAVERPEAETSAPRPSGPLRIPPVVPTTPVLAALYPKTLLIAFRLLNTHFPRSLLISQFHSTIKEHGRLSAMLGASSGLYDELITYQWRVCKDLPAVIGILREMNQLGVNPSNKSRGLLTNVIVRQGRDLKAYEESSDGREFFWNLPSNREAFEELTCKDGWMDKIEAASNEAKQQRLSRTFQRQFS
ncbi:unnamed protein product [Penicillium olsonii]|nr:unnamed protein product [Penicillium olsonii]CAG7934654.1 unnamed protein product [Penicillium olsonii]